MPDITSTLRASDQDRRYLAMQLAVEHFHSDSNVPASKLFSVAEVIEEYIKSGKVPNFPSAAPTEFPDPPSRRLQSIQTDLPPG